MALEERLETSGKAKGDTQARRGIKKSTKARGVATSNVDILFASKGRAETRGNAWSLVGARAGALKQMNARESPRGRL